MSPEEREARDVGTECDDADDNDGDFVFRWLRNCDLGRLGLSAIIDYRRSANGFEYESVIN